ncbi:PQQ-binding-like beta-propeller repeat protein [bacterium]|nr:PQQ-binding-like beta-propeller repeat protein [bacterium]
MKIASIDDRAWRSLMLIGWISFSLVGRGEEQQWSQFRGKESRGRSGVEHFPITWGDKNILWKVAVEGPGDSSVSVWGDSLFYLASQADGTKRQVLCRHLHDGSLQWSYSIDFDTHPKHAKNSYATATPAVGEDGVYACFGSPKRFVVVAIDFAGKERWMAELGPYISQHGPGASPILVGNNVIMAIEQDGPSRIVAIDRATGKIAWASDRPSKLAAYATPLFVDDRLGGQLVVSSVVGVSGLDASTGKVLWEENCFVDRCVSSPILVDSADGLTVLAGSGKGGKGNRTVALNIDRSLSPGQSRVRWDLTKTIPYCPTPISLGESIYFALDSGVVRSVRAADGSEIWTERVCDKVTASPIEIGGNVLIVSETGQCVFLAPRSTFQSVGRNQLDDEFLATPAVAKGRLLLRGTNHIWCIGEP